MLNANQIGKAVEFLGKATGILLNGEWGYKNKKTGEFSPAKWIAGVYPQMLSHKDKGTIIETSVMILLKQAGFPCPSLADITQIIQGVDKVRKARFAYQDAAETQEYLNKMWESNFSRGTWAEKNKTPEGLVFGVWGAVPNTERNARRLLALPEGVGELIAALDISSANTTISTANSIVTADGTVKGHK